MSKANKEGKAVYFASDYKGEIKPVNLEKSDKSVQLHVEKIQEANVESVLDLGCGSGGILLALQNAGIKEIHGIDASPEAIEMMKKRFEKYGTLEGTTFTAGDIIQYDPPVVEAVSSHMVLCCHPNAVGIVSKATEKKPKMVVISYPQDKLLFKIALVFLNVLIWFGGLFKKSIRGFKAFAHSTELVNSTFEENGYKLIFSEKSFIVQTLIYELIDENKAGKNGELR